MRFRRSATQSHSVTLAANGNVGHKRKPGGFRRRFYLIVLPLLVVVGVQADEAWISADGIVAGALTAVSPIVQARLQNVFVKCLDRVVRGQPVAEFRNEVTAEAAAQQLLGLQLLHQNALSQIDIARAAAESAQKLVEAQDAVVQQLSAVLQAQNDLVKYKFVANLVWQNAKAAVARSEAERAAAIFVYQQKKEEVAKAVADAELLHARIESLQNAAELIGHFTLKAPKDGIVTDCTALPGDVIQARTPIFQVFNIDDAYGVVFADPADIKKIAVGQNITLHVKGIYGDVEGHITGFYPELAALPVALTRYFWQKQQWSQYVPVRIDFLHMSSVQKSHLGAWAQIYAFRWDADAAWGIWPWAERQVRDAWKIITQILVS